MTPDVLEDIGLSELADTWLSLQEEIDRLTQARNACSGELLRAMGDAKEMVVDGKLVKRVEQYTTAEWDVSLLIEEAMPILTKEEWGKAFKEERVPEHWEQTVNTRSMAAALERKGEAGRAVLERAMKRELKRADVKVTRG